MAGQIVSEKATVRSGQTQSNLDPLFAPKSVAVIGATENLNAVGRTVLANLIKTPFGGTVYPVNPKRSAVMGIKAYPSIKDVPE
jgi:acetyltransferase